MPHAFFWFAGMVGALVGCASGALVLCVGACINSWRHYTILALAIVTTLVIQFVSTVKTPDTDEHPLEWVIHYTFLYGGIFGFVAGFCAISLGIPLCVRLCRR